MNGRERILRTEQNRDSMEEREREGEEANGIS